MILRGGWLSALNSIPTVAGPTLSTEDCFLTSEAFLVPPEEADLTALLELLLLLEREGRFASEGFFMGSIEG